MKSRPTDASPYDRNLFHKIGYLVASKRASFFDLVRTFVAVNWGPSDREAYLEVREGGRVPSGG